MTFDHIADVVVAGAGAAGLAAAIMAADQGASVLVVEANHDIGGHAMLSGGNVPLGGGNRLQKKYGIEDSPDLVYLDHTSHRGAQFRHGDRDLVRVWADENVDTFNFLLDNGVVFDEEPPELMNRGSVPRRFRVTRFSDDITETINGRPGSGLARNLERSARAKGVTFLLEHRMTSIVREEPTSGRVLGMTASTPDGDTSIRARKGVIVATGGHTSNVEFRRMLDPRLTEEYQTAGEPWTPQDASGEIQAMAIGAAFLSSGNQDNGAGPLITKTKHIGCRWGYRNLKWSPKSPLFKHAGASGLTVNGYDNMILVNRVGQRFWNEDEDTYNFLAACLGTHGDLGRSEAGANGGGPIWAVFDAAGAEREGWTTAPPHVDPNGWFFTGQTLAELAANIVNPYQRAPLPAQALEDTVARYNGFIDAGKDADFGKTTLEHKIETAPFYAAWATPILHDSLTGLKIDTRARVIDTRGEVIAGLYCAGESAGGFGLHGLPRVLVFGRIAGREAALAEA